MSNMFRGIVNTAYDIYNWSCDSYKRVFYYRVQCAYCSTPAYVEEFDSEYTCDYKCNLSYQSGRKKPEVFKGLQLADAPIYHDLSRKD